MYDGEYYYSKFPESLFSVKNPENFKARVLAGLEKCEKLNVAFCCLGRDIESILHTNMCRINRTASFFNDAQIFIVENDSSDNTALMLKKYELSDNRIKIISASVPDKKLYSNTGDESLSIERVSKMATLRNIYLDEISSLKKIDYVIVIDLDIQGGWSHDGFLDCFSRHKSSWSAMTSNGLIFFEEVLSVHDNKNLKVKTQFFDTWTFRELGEEKFAGHGIYRNMSLEKGEVPMEVGSNFNGLGIYKYEDIIKCEYRPSTPDEDVCCEHVSLHQQIRKNGGKVFINPSLITLYSPTEYAENHD
tara:strand:- start:5371 stop:6282 length:912 start_codon:yes stop_codon:yes gene_type:complete